MFSAPPAKMIIHLAGKNKRVFLIVKVRFTDKQILYDFSVCCIFFATVEVWLSHPGMSVL